jgi:anti-sigma-K factor RskA
MRYDDPRLLSLLAGEYVLGTLTHRARLRFDRLLATKPQARAAVAEWEERFVGLSMAVPPVAPSPRVWEHIAEQLGLGLGLAPAPARRSFWQAPLLWQALAAALALVAIALGIERMRILPRLAELEQQVAAARDSGQQLEQQLARTTGDVAKLREELQAAQTALSAPQYVSVMADPSGKPLWLVKLGERTLRVTVVGAAKEQPGKAYELWMLPEGGNPVSLGVLPQRGDQTVALSDAALAVLARSSALAVSLEPEGGSPTGLPTGPVLYTAPLLRG